MALGQRPTYEREALKRAAALFEDAIKVAAGRFSTEIPAAVHTYYTTDFAWISAGTRTGEWGWTPIHAWMFEEPHAGSIPKHPLFGNRKKWYYQPYRPYIEEGMYAAINEAENLYADIVAAGVCAEYGFK